MRARGTLLKARARHRAGGLALLLAALLPMAEARGQDADCATDWSKLRNGVLARPLTLVEDRVWQALCDRQRYDGRLADESGAAARVEIGADFVRGVLASNRFAKPDQSTIPLAGVRILGDLRLDSEIVRTGISIRDSEFTGTLFMRSARIMGDLDLSGSSLPGGLVGERVRIEGDLTLGHAIDGAVVQAGLVDLSESRIAGTVLIDKVAFRPEDPEAPALRIRDADVSRTLRIQSSAFFSNVELWNLQVGLVEVARSVFHDNLNFQSAAIASAMTLHYVDADRHLILAGTRVNRDFAVKGGTFAIVDATGLFVGNEFVMDCSDWLDPLPDGAAAVPGIAWVPPTTRGAAQPRLTLDNAKFSLFRVHSDPWPRALSVSMQAVAFQTLAARAGRCPGESNAADDPDARFFRLLQKAEYSKRTADTFRRYLLAGGEDDFAARVGKWAAANEHARMSTSRTTIFGFDDQGTLSWVLSAPTALYGIFFGFGYYAEAAIFWAAALTFFGAWLFSLYRSRYPTADLERFFALAYSFDRLLPWIKLDERHYRQEISSKAIRLYFAFHQFCGFLLGLCIAASLSKLWR